MLKAICIGDHSNIESLLETYGIHDIRGNINLKIVKLFTIQNNKGMTPLVAAVDAGDK